MAYVSIRWGQSAAHHINYALKDRAPDDAAYAHDCSLETAASDFESVRSEHNKDGGNQVLHVMQSFSPTDSKMHDAEDLNALGQSFALANFPGHQFIVKTHTDTGKIHNHIIVNTVNSETGKKIENKRALIFQLQNSSDKFCKEYGLSIINRDAKERQARLPFKVQQMVRAGKQSYIFDLSQKADVARSIATNFDEYRDILSGFGIRTVIEEKNISYFYPGKERGKRGSKLGRPYGKEGLLEKFQANDKKFSGYPELKARFYKQCAEVQKHGMPPIPDGASNFSKHWNGGDHPWNHPDYFTKVKRRESKEHFKSETVLQHAFVPANEIKRATEKSIFDYCKQNKIGLTKNNKGETVFKGKEFVTVTEFGFINNKNGTRGSLIDLVAAHINGNARLNLLEQYAGEVPQKYKSFHVPKADKGTAKKVAYGLEQAFHSMGYSSSFKAHFSERRIEQMGKHGGAWVFLKDEPSDKNTAHLFDSIALQHHLSFFAATTSNKTHLSEHFEKHTKPALDLFLIENPHVKKVNFVLLGPRGNEHANADIFSLLIKRYEGFGITIATHSNERSIQKGIDLDLFGHGKSHSKGGLDIGF